MKGHCSYWITDGDRPRQDELSFGPVNKVQEKSTALCLFRQCRVTKKKKFYWGRLSSSLCSVFLTAKSFLLFLSLLPVNFSFFCLFLGRSSTLPILSR
ncbi:uncharacterized protein NPIL_43821 [Nephila pilipes]|uniref:Uncharacterized protein n=1 Tax=Nephila pilipes TaxID=299642 RepID=A0A8X6NXI4_NEPPI|nr:uncharacterized protein NPIL_43821 [Nephila pilipes]